jgi:hypothetical protein
MRLGRNGAMLDVVLIALALGCFGFGVLYTFACENL